MGRRRKKGPDVWNDITHESFAKIPRLFRDCIITEKIDGTNALIHITDDGVLMPGSRRRWLSPDRSDNYGFAAWCREHEQELIDGLGPGSHYGEWWGSGIQRAYGLKNGDREFSLFNVHRWGFYSDRPNCCSCVPVLYQGPFDTSIVNDVMMNLRRSGSMIVPDFDRPEGIVIFMVSNCQLYKYTFDGDGHKGE